MSQESPRPLTRERSNSRVNDFLSEIEPLYFYHERFPGSTEFFSQYDPSQLPELHDRPLEESKAEIIEAFSGEHDWREFTLNQPQILKDLQQAIRMSVKHASFQKMLACWPIVCPDDPALRNLLLFFAHLLEEQDPTVADNIMSWLVTSFVPENWHRGTSMRNSIIKAACQISISKRKGDFWIVLDMHNRFFVQVPGSGGEMTIVGSGRVSSVAVEEKQKAVKLLDPAGEVLLRFTPKEPSQVEIWKTILTKDPVPFPVRLTSKMDGQIPSQIVPALYEALIADDMLVLRTLTHYSVVKVAEGVPLSFALLDIFAYAGKVNQFLVAMVGNEFNNESLKPTSVLRVNSHLTNLFKVWNERFGKEYVQAVIKKMIDFVDSFGDLGLTDPETCDEHGAKKSLLTCLRAVLNSQEHVSPEMRHLASILKSVSGCRFNRKQATFNTLSGYFFLRFVTALFTCPEGFDKSIKLTDGLTKVITHFSPLLQSPFNLISFGGKYNRFSGWNRYIQKKIFPDLVNFAFSVAEIDEVPEYPAPPRERLEKSLETVLRFMSASGDRFVKRFNDLLKERADLVQPVGWNVGAFVQSLFKNNIAD